MKTRIFKALFWMGVGVFVGTAVGAGVWSIVGTERLVITRPVTIIETEHVVFVDKLLGCSGREVAVIASGDPDVPVCVDIAIANIILDGIQSQPLSQSLTDELIWPASSPRDRLGRPLMRQSDFPCAEDEMLSFAAVEVFEGASIPAAIASRDYVGCIHIDVIVNNILQEAVQHCGNLGMYVIGGSVWSHLPECGFGDNAPISEAKSLGLSEGECVVFPASEAYGVETVACVPMSAP